MRKPYVLACIFLLLTPLFSSRPIVVEDPPQVSSHNPLMPEPDQLYNFHRVNDEAIRSASMYTENKVTMLLSAIAGISDQERTFENTMSQVDEVYNVLQKATSVYELLVNAHPDKQVRDLSGEMLEKFTTMTDELMLNENLYRAVKAYSQTNDGMGQIGERAYFIRKIMRQFEMNGMALKPAERDTLKALNSRLNELGVQFGKNISGDKTMVGAKESELTGLKPDFTARFKKADGDYQFDLSTPTYTTFMSQCSNTEARKRMYIAKMNIGGAANEKILADVLNLRTRKAKLLGFSTYSAYSTSDIMSQNPQRVWDFEKGLARDLRPKAEADLKALLEIKNKMNPGKTPSKTIQPYESAFYTNELLKSKYNVDQEKVKEYFEINNVINGIFTVYQKMYRLRFEEDKNPSTWHSDVKAYSVYDNESGARIGYFYLDLYPRPDKYNHFGCFSLTGSKKFSDDSRQLQCAALVCNFPPPADGKPSLLPHGTVTTFLHEFGHLIHVLLSETELAYFAGTNVATDFVEAPSQMMENWGWDRDVLSMFGKHYQTGATIPTQLVESMIAARNVNSGLNTLQQVYYGTLDFTLNDNPPPANAEAIVGKTKELQNSITLYPWVEGTHFAGSFGHLIGYGSRYYGYLWSLVYSADMYSEFVKTGPLASETGARYRMHVLSKGGSDDAIMLVKNFLGREPNNKAFLKQLGI